MTNAAGELPLFREAARNASKPAIDAVEGSFTYGDLLRASAHVATRLLAIASGNGVAADVESARDLAGSRIAFMITPGFSWAAVQWGIWRAGGIAVPLALSHPPPELAYALDETGAAVVIADDAHHAMIGPLAIQRGLNFVSISELLPQGGPADDVGSPPRGVYDPPLPTPFDESRGALILFTSGTTSRPKGVVITHANIEAQTAALREAWGWTASDRILCTLPLHHLHGIINVLTCALRSGAHCTIQPGFDAETAWRAIGEGRFTLFMAVPTIYARLIAAWESAPPRVRDRWTSACRRMRLMVSGSAALPVTVLERWREISGHTLLERYGMTEIGMALSNPLHGERRPGFVGSPLPGVEIRLVDEAGDLAPPGTPGEIEVRGPAVFSEYWRRPDATREAFRDGWFRTGDVAVIERGSYRILGRISTDIIKTGGYKVSALEIEEVLRTHAAVQECAVVGVADAEWGERVCAAVVPASGSEIDTDALRIWAKTQLAPYKVPSRIAVVSDLPRNAMGKVTKPAVVKLFEPSAVSA